MEDSYIGILVFLSVAVFCSLFCLKIFDERLPAGVLACIISPAIFHALVHFFGGGVDMFYQITLITTAVGTGIIFAVVCVLVAIVKKAKRSDEAI